MALKQPKLQSDLDVKIYTVYHEDIQIERRKLINDNITVTYNVNDDKGLNHLNRFLNEWVAQDYVGKNINSQYVGFQHYRRWFYDIPKHLDDDEVYCAEIKYPWNFKDYVCKGLFMERLWSLMLEFLEPYDKRYTDMLCNEKSVFICREMFITKSDNLIKMNQFIREYIDFICRKYDIELDFQSLKTCIYENDIKKLDEQENKPSWVFADKSKGLYNIRYRLFSYGIEILESLYLAVNFKLSTHLSPYFWQKSYVNEMMTKKRKPDWIDVNFY